MPNSTLRTSVVSLWLSLITLAILGLGFAEALRLTQGKAQAWSYYLTASEVAFEVAVRLFSAALAGIVLATVCTALIVPFLWRFKESRQRIIEWAIKASVVAVVFLDSRYALKALIHSLGGSYGSSLTNALLTLHFLVFVAALCVYRARAQVMKSLDLFLGEKMTRRTAIATVAGTAGLAIAEYALSKNAAVVKAALPADRPKSNILLITFDALTAEDMSLYGYGLPTTPNIDAFAAAGTVFKNFYSASTFTTPSIATMLTGVYPTQHKVFQLTGGLPQGETSKSLPHALRAAGYITSAFVSNAYAYYLARDIKGGFDLLPEPVFQRGGLQQLWSATEWLHQDSRIGSRIDEYTDLANTWNSLSGRPLDSFRRFRAADTFACAEQMVAGLPDGFFLWVHIMTPHSPYLPGAAERNKFIPDEKLKTFEFEGDEAALRWYPHYEPDQQEQIDMRRLAYDEFVATGDRAFGAFMSTLEKSGRMRNTTVIVSADHGESFEGGIYQHETQYMTRPVIHIPLIIRTPDQQEGRAIEYVADQTALAPTILELANVPKPSWMPGESLARWLNSASEGKGEGLAFSQFFEINSIFEPLRHGTVGVIDGKYQYLVVLNSQTGVLRPLKEAHLWNIDRSSDEPARAASLSAAVYSKFPEILQ